MTFGRRPATFGKKTPSAPPAFPSAPRDSDGKRRIFGEAIYATHGDFLRLLGRDINDPDNVLPEAEDFDRMVQESLAAQEVRRCALEAVLLARHGVNDIRPFFVLAEPVMNSQIGAWLIRVMNLMPYEEWNLVYLPVTPATAAVMNLPLHPQQSIGPIDELMVERIGGFYARYQDGLNKVRGLDEAADGFMDTVERFLAWKAELRQQIIDYVLSVKPMIVELIADVQANTPRH